MTLATLGGGGVIQGKRKVWYAGGGIRSQFKILHCHITNDYESILKVSNFQKWIIYFDINPKTKSKVANLVTRILGANFASYPFGLVV